MEHGLQAVVAERIMYVILLWISLSVHEWAHAWAAFRLGDDTAAMMGRLTINPLAHVDPVGTLLLPLLGVPIGWATPVPVNPVRFTRKVSMWVGMAIVALAGPVSNVLLAIGALFTLVVIGRVQPEMMDPENGPIKLLLTLVGMNIGLACFNMLPVPPLDGSRIVDAFCPRQLRPLWQQFSQIGSYVLLAILFLSVTMWGIAQLPLHAISQLIRALSGG